MHEYEMIPFYIMQIFHCSLTALIHVMQTIVTTFFVLPWGVA